MYTVIQRRPTACIVISKLTLRDALTLLDQGRHSGFRMSLYVAA